jgi:uncharacterized protein (DUF58 family)
VRRASGAAGLGAALVVAGVAFGLPSLTVPGVAIVLLAGAAAAWVGLVGRADVVRELGPPAVEEETPWPVRIFVRTGGLPLPGGELREPLLGRAITMRGRPRRVRVDVRFGRRGLRRLEPARLAVRDPLGLAERELASEPGEVLVLPRIEPVHAPADGAGPPGPVGPRGSRPAEGAEVEFDALRPYRPGAPATHIHWPTVARTGEMVERRLVADADPRPLVVLDAHRPVSEDALDKAVRAAASLCVHLARDGGCALLLPGERRAADLDAELRAWPGLHARLAVVESGIGVPASSALVERAGAVLWVTAAAPGGLASALARSGAGARYVVSPLPAGRGPAAFTVAGCGGWLLGARRRAAA